MQPEHMPTRRRPPAAPGPEGAGLPARSTLIISAQGWAELAERATGIVGEYHRQYPLRAGIAREELKSRLKQSARVFTATVDRLSEEGRLSGSATSLWLPGHAPRFTAQQQAQVERLLAEVARQPYTTPLVVDAEAQVGSEVFAALVEQGRLVRISGEVFFLAATYQEMVQRILDELQTNGKITVGEVRDLFGTSRKYVLALMEHLDERKITRRIGDERVLRTQRGVDAD